MVLKGISLPAPNVVFTPLLLNVIPIMKDIIKIKTRIVVPILLKFLLVGRDTRFFLMGISLNKSWKRPKGQTHPQVVFPKIDPNSKKTESARYGNIQYVRRYCRASKAFQTVEKGPPVGKAIGKSIGILANPKIKPLRSPNITNCTIVLIILILWFWRGLSNVENIGFICFVAISNHLTYPVIGFGKPVTYALKKSFMRKSVNELISVYLTIWPWTIAIIRKIIPIAKKNIRYILFLAFMMTEDVKNYTY